MTEIEDHYYAFIEQRLVGYGIRNKWIVKLFGEVMSDLQPVPSQVCSCGKPVVFVMHSREFECTRCGKGWQLKMEVKPIS